MALVGKLETEIEVNSSADAFFHAYTTKAHIVPKTCQETLHNVEVLEGDYASSGSLKQWTFNLVQSVKGKIEVDEAQRKVTSTTVEGEILKQFKSFTVSIQVTPKAKGSLVKWTWEYERETEDISDPNKFIDLATNITKDVDAYAITASA